jgi:hypothetical protein
VSFTKWFSKTECAGLAWPLLSRVVLFFHNDDDAKLYSNIIYVLVLKLFSPSNKVTENAISPFIRILGSKNTRSDGCVVV